MSKLGQGPTDGPAVLVTECSSRRHAVGHMAKAAAFLELLPQSVADRILKKRF